MSYTCQVRRPVPGTKRALINADSFICYTRWKGNYSTFQFPMKLGLAHITTIRWRCLGIMYSSEKAKFLKEKALALDPYHLIALR